MFAASVISTMNVERPPANHLRADAGEHAIQSYERLFGGQKLPRCASSAP